MHLLKLSRELIDISRIKISSCPICHKTVKIDSILGEHQSAEDERLANNG
jgi:hypothetical protein